METRKVQITGGSTYAVSLPKSWAIASGINKGDSVIVVPQDDGSLLITPKSELSRKLRRKRFEVVEDAEADHIIRKLVGAYIAGYSEIEVEMNPRLSPEVRQAVRDFSRMTIGTEIIDESTRRMAVRDLLDPSDLPFEKSTRRMYYISRRMLSDAIQSFVNNDQELAMDVTSRDVEVDRLNWLMARQYHMTTRDPALAEKLGVSRTVGMNYILISRLIERIADHSCKICHNVQNLKGVKLPDKFCKEISKAGEKAMESYDRSLESFFGQDIDSLNDTMDDVYRVRSECEKIAEGISKWGKEGAVAASNIVESIRRTLSYANNIAEVSINHLVDDSS
ncbi:MAG: phosphate uptake regulator PhoU [Thermoplasmata archaeon]|nr:phosphate uptake regulator PhoU [Thermoplasmata archaeon]